MADRDWVWVTPAVAEAAHAEQIAEHGGGGDGLRDRGLFESAMARPHNQMLYGDPDAAALAAAYAYGLARNHAFIDGNKRSGSLLFIHYLAENGLLFRESGERTVNDNTIVALALLISQSHPSDKEIMIRLITNLLS